MAGLGLLAASLLVVALALAAGSLSASPDTIDFGGQDVDGGATATETSTITNAGPDPVTINSVELQGADTDQFAFDPQAGDCDGSTVLAQDEMCNVHVAFDPTSLGAKSATLVVVSPDGDANVALAGEGTQTELAADPDFLPFGGQEIADGPTATQTSVVENTGSEPVDVGAVTFAGDTGDFNQLTDQGTDCTATTTLDAGQTCELRIEFDPATTGTKSATVTVESNAPDETVDLSGTGTQTELAADPDALAFGSREVGDGPTATQTSVVENIGSEPVDVDAVTFAGDTGDFNQLTGQGTDCTDTTTLSTGETCDVRIEFDPASTGAKSATVTVESNAPDEAISLSGTGTETELTATPGSLPFGAQDVDAGPTAAQDATVENTGDQPVTIAAVTLGGANPKQFQRLTGDVGDCAATTTLQPGEDCAVRAVFDPSFKGAKSATITVDSNAPDVTMSLTGTGIESSYESSDDPLDEGHVTNGQVNAVAFDSAGRTYLGGTFTHVGPRTGHGVKLSESSDVPASGFPDVNGTIRAVAPDGAGGWFIGGDFTSVGNVPRDRLAHIQSSGALDSGWAPSADGRVNALVVDAGNVFAGGEFAAIDGTERTFLAKLSATSGALDTDWHPIVNSSVFALAVDGTALHVGGDFTQIGGTSRNRLARVSTAGSGTVDALWDPDVNGSVTALAVSAGDVYAGGTFTTVGGEARQRIVKLTGSAGAPDAGWNPGADNRVSALAISGSDLYAGGSFTTIGGQPRPRAAKLSTTTGTVDTGFNAAPDAAVHALALSAAGLYAAGEFTQIGGEGRSRLARVSATTGAADGWDPRANGTARAVALAGAEVYAGGDFTSVGATARDRLARLEPDGTLDADWNPGANNTVSALIVSGADVYIGGAFTTVAGQSRARLAKLSVGGGAVDVTWNPGATGVVSALAVSGTTVYAGGLFLTIDGQSRSRLARLTGATGALDAAWAPAGASGQVTALALSGTNLFAGGAFTSIGGASRDRIAKLDAGGTGVVDAGWNPGASNTVSALAASGTELYAGGFFSTIGGQARNFVARLDTGTGAVDTGWDPDANSVVRALALSPTDVYAGGDFTRVSDHPHNRLAKLPRSGSGAADSGWDPEVTGGNVHALAVSGDRLAAGGSFTAVGGQSSQGFALLELPTLASDPGGLHFGEHDVDDGPTALMTSTITNPRAQPVTFTAVSLGGPDAAQFERLTGDPQDCTASTVLDEDETCTVRARFDPTSSGEKVASIAIVSDSPGIQVALTGTGAQTALSPDPASLSFGPKDIDDGATAIQTSTVTNAGTEQVDFSSVTVEGAGAADFERLTDEPSDCTDTTILQPSQTCTLRARFDPIAVGTKSAALTIESSADDMSVALSGTGIQTQLSRSPASLAFGAHDIDDGATGAQVSTVSNSGTETVTLTGVDVTGDGDQFVRLTSAGDDCATGTALAGGQACKVRMQFDPASTGAKAATVTVTSNAADVTVGLSGTGTQTQLTADPDALSFGSRDIDDGPAAEQESVVTNTGSEPVTIAAVNLTGDTADFTRATDEDGDCAAADVLAPNDTCTVRVEFDPVTVGPKSATVTIDSNAPDETIALTGAGIQTELSRAPASLSFGARDIDDGATAAQESTVTNSGTQTVDLDAVTIGGTDAADFVQLTDQGTDCTAATTLTAGQTCKLRIRFDPGATGAKSATVTVESDAADVSVTLSGTGTQTLLTRDPATLAFGNHNIEDPPSAAQSSTVTNAGSEDVTFTAIAFTGDTAHFEHLTGQAGDCTASTTLTAGQTCVLRARFAPTTTGAKSATLTVSSNAADVSVALTGKGVLTRLERSADTLAFGARDIDDGPTATQTSTITNTGSETVTFSSVALSGDTTQFERLTGQSGDCADDTVLTAGQSCALRARFDPTTPGAKSAAVTIQSDAADQVVALTGTGTQTLLTRSPGTLSFGSRHVDDGPTATQTSTITNAGSETVDLDAVDVTGDSTEFERLTSHGADCTAATSLTAGQTCELRLRFDPTDTGAKAATVTVDSNAADVTVALSGTGTQTQLTSDPGDLAFGARDIDDGATAAQTSVVVNTGSEPVTFTAITVDAGWARLTGETSDCADDEALAAGETCALRIAFDPSATGAQTGAVTIESNAPEETVALSGTGTQTELTRSPTTLAFGDRDINEGATAAQESTVTNTGTEPVSIAAVNESGDTGASFTRLTDQGSDCSDTTTLTTGQTCKVRVRFDPSAQGAEDATYTVDS
ncbi:MAG TPA: choice-of-anchor D domain-containing protein, partial [Solirubrobacteraceae bacterium]